MRKYLLLLLVAVLGLSGAGCRIATPPTAEAASTKPRVTGPHASSGEIDALVSGNTAFAFDLYQALRGGEGNLFYSPFSISIALAMTYAGARGETAQEMAETLRFELEPDQLHQAFNYLDQLLNSRGQGAKGKDGKGFRLNVVNAIWGQRDYRFLAAYLDALAENYGAGIRLLNFVASPEPSRQTINQWVSDQTEKRIPELIAAGLIDQLTRLVLTNAVYFNAAWMYPFSEGATREGAFYLADGSEVSKQMMSVSEWLGYAQGDGYQAVELPYDGGELSMVIMVPDAGEFGRFEAGLDDARIAGIIDQIEHQQVQLTMPKFEFESEFSLGAILAGMGMPLAFSGQADFSGITGDRDLAISEVVHKAFVGVDEAGTEAAAATAVIMRLTAMPAEPVRLQVDRPFVFLIRDLETGTLLFLGRIVQ